MAVSNRVLGFMAAVAIGLACWSVLDVATAVMRHRQLAADEQATVTALRDSAYRLGLQVRTAAARDQVDSALQSYPTGKAPRLVVLGRAAPAAAVLSESLFATLPVPPDPALALSLVLVEAPQPPRWPIGLLTSFAIMPSASESGCTTVAILFPRDSVLDQYQARFWRDHPFGGAAGPCWFVARFGLPGPQIRAWLDARYWDVAGSIPPHDPPLVTAKDDLRGAGVFERVFGSVATKFYGESVTLEGCAGRRPELCEESFLGSPYPPGLLPAGIVGNSRFNNYMLFRGEGSPLAFFASSGSVMGMPRVASEALLAMMVEWLGPTRFAEFWTSAAPVGEAFTEAAGMSLGDWYRVQLRRQMVAAGRPEPRDPVSWPFALTILALALGATLWGAQRRQVR